MKGKTIRLREMKKKIKTPTNLLLKSGTSYYLRHAFNPISLGTLYVLSPQTFFAVKHLDTKAFVCGLCTLDLFPNPNGVTSFMDGPLLLKYFGQQQQFNHQQIKFKKDHFPVIFSISDGLSQPK